MTRPTMIQATDFFHSPAFSHGLLIVDSEESALEQIEYTKQFYVPELFCGQQRNLKPVRHDHRRKPVTICLRSHTKGLSHGWKRLDGQQLGQSLLGFQMAADFISVLRDICEAETTGRSAYESTGPSDGRGVELHLLPPLSPEWSGFRW